MDETRKTRKRDAPPTSSVNGNGNGSHKEPPVELPDGPPSDLQNEEAADEFSDVGTPPEMLKVNTADMQSAGRDYQRPLDLWYVKKLVKRFKWIRFRAPFVNIRPDGSIWIIDGHHRVTALRERLGDQEIVCFVSRLEGVKEEAELADLMDDGHANISVETRFQRRLTRGEPTAVEIERIAREAGYAISLHEKTVSEFQLTIPAVLDGIYNHKKLGPEALSAILQFAKATWGGQKGFASSHTITGLRKFWEFFQDSPNFDPTRISAVLSEFPLSEVERHGKEFEARTLGHRHRSFAFAMQDLFNSRNPRMRDKLRDLSKD